jgi:NADH-quinone oxidoreductase subunit A
MLQDYLPVLLQVIVAIGFAVSALLTSVLLGKSGRRTQAKDTAYECGMLPQGGAQPRFSVKFYLVAIVFILFDIEAVFLYPWAVVYRELKMFAFFEMLLFVGLVVCGFFYVWKKGALDWSGEAPVVTSRRTPNS